MKTKSIKLALAAAALAMTPAAAHAVGPPGGMIDNGPLSLFYRILWLLDVHSDRDPVYSCQYRGDCSS